ncbi:MAG TPA: heavy metal sensor histidine kinase [Schlesneria sp.]|jgi:heavy metal sensor kinase
MTSRLKIRWKLTLWYGGVLAAVLFVFGALVFLIMRHHLLERIDQGLNEELSDVLSEVGRAKTAPDLTVWLNRRFAAHAGFDFQISRQNGERFFYNPRLATKAWPLPESSSATSRFYNLPVEANADWRVVHVTAEGPEGLMTVQVGRSLAAFNRELNELLMTFFLAGPLTLLAAISGGYFLACRALNPIQEMTHAARSISADRLHDRIPIVNPHDEIGELGQTLNQMIERLERSFTEMQRFTADAAHELRTPLAIIRNETEVALRSQRSVIDDRHVLENVLEETNRLSAVADQLLFLCRQDAGLSAPTQERVDLDQLLLELVNNMRLVAQEKQQSIVLEENPSCQVVGDRHQLLRVFYNLVDNAIKYSPDAGQITIGSSATADRIVVRVSDTGIGIPSQDLSRIFDRFYRVDASRGGEVAGTGLGLSICQSILRSHGGAIEVDSKVGHGSTFSVQLTCQPVQID